MRVFARSLAAIVWFAALVAGIVLPGTAEPLQAQENPYEALKEIAIIEEMVMIPMRDGIQLATHIYRPKRRASP